MSRVCACLSLSKVCLRANSLSIAFGLYLSSLTISSVSSSSSTISSVSSTTSSSSSTISSSSKLIASPQKILMPLVSSYQYTLCLMLQ
ncbi:site-specific integrase-resolvase-like protein [Sulfolobus islandicus L.S.2.15]|uniref:Site-specific integrase-resolvase-like protein n=1 Tax=Saccharolobus islandicus (strain L.S.2.15 / Lassen \|nr:site-specific integrase-resolvase-like protein [Sulfolobus islandicus L.S.2.15]